MGRFDKAKVGQPDADTTTELKTEAPEAPETPELEDSVDEELERTEDTGPGLTETPDETQHNEPGDILEEDGIEPVVQEEDGELPPVDEETHPELEDELETEADDTIENETSPEVLPDVANLQTVIYGPEQVMAVLSNPELSFKEKLEEIGKFAKGELGMLANGLISYGYSMSKERGIVDAKVGVSNNYSLYTLMKSVIDTKDYNDFKVKFDIINLAFLAYKDDAFDDTRLVRFDTQWTWGNVSLTTYIFLVRAVYELANIETREKLKKTIDPKRLFDDKMTAFSAEARNNIKRYYQL